MKWQKGSSGNPRGRPLGTNAVGQLRASLAEHVPAILESLVAAAKRGDVGAAKLVLERVVPALKSEELPVALDGISGSRVEMVAAVIDAIASGKLDAARGGRLIIALAPDALEERIEKWERIVQEQSKMMSSRKRLAICEAVIAGTLSLDEANRRRAEVLKRSRRGRILLRIERAERIVGVVPRT